MNAQLKKGVLEMCVLSLLSERDYYGFELVSLIPPEINMSEGTVYPLLKRLKDGGLLTTYWAESTEGPPRKYYKISEEGRVTCQKMRREWGEFFTAVNTFLSKEGNNDE